ncbi:MAG: hypothetical protein Q9159_003366 [Coniocarpon cinnabarinum]
MLVRFVQILGDWPWPYYRCAKSTLAQVSGHQWDTSGRRGVGAPGSSGPDAAFGAQLPPDLLSDPADRRASDPQSHLAKPHPARDPLPNPETPACIQALNHPNTHVPPRTALDRLASPSATSTRRSCQSRPTTWPPQRDRQLPQLPITPECAEEYTPTSQLLLPFVSHLLEYARFDWGVALNAMRAPARLFGISLTVFIALTLILSRLESETVTRTINKFPSIKQQWQARSAAMQSHFSSSSSSTANNAAACDVDAKACVEPYTSHDAPVDEKPRDQTGKEYESTEAMEHSKEKRPSTKDRDRDKDRGFTDAEQAAALERLEFKYGAEAKADDSSVLWMETTTTQAWGAGHTTAVTTGLDSEAERARKILGEEYGDQGQEEATMTGKTGTATTTTTGPDSDETEKGWRTTGFETRAKSSQKSLISGGGGNGTATGTAAIETGELMEEAVGTAATLTSTGKTEKTQAAQGAKVTSTKPKATGKGKNKWAKKLGALEIEEVVTEVVMHTTEKSLKPTRRPTKEKQKVVEHIVDAAAADDDDETSSKTTRSYSDTVSVTDSTTTSTAGQSKTTKLSLGSLKDKGEVEEQRMWRNAERPARAKLLPTTTTSDEEEPEATATESLADTIVDESDVKAVKGKGKWAKKMRQKQSETGDDGLR